MLTCTCTQGNLSFVAECAKCQEELTIPGTKQRFSGKRVNAVVTEARK